LSSIGFNSTTIGFAQKTNTRKRAKAKAICQLLGAQNNPYFKDNTSEVQCFLFHGKDLFKFLKTRTKVIKLTKGLP
jgi:hypothetical protein